jgi:hypothetical protein
MQLGPVSCRRLKNTARTPMNVSTGLALPGRKTSARFSFRWPARGLKPPPVPEPDQLTRRPPIPTLFKQRSEKPRCRAQRSFPNSNLGGREGAMIGGDQGQPPRTYDALKAKRFTGRYDYFLRTGTFVQPPSPSEPIASTRANGKMKYLDRKHYERRRVIIHLKVPNSPPRQSRPPQLTQS